MRNIAKTNYTVKEIKEKKKPRIQFCGYSVNSATGVPVNLCKSIDGKLFFNGVANCGSYWRCPVCAVKIAENKRQIISALITEHQKNKQYAGFLTLTVRHKKTDTLKKTLDKLLNNYRKFQNLKFHQNNKNLIGQIKTLEITWTYNNGWHPHLHLLYFYQNQEVKEIEHFQKEVISRWSKYKDNNATISAQNSQILTNDISDYLAKYDITSEMTKANIKSSKGLTPFTALGKLAVQDYENHEEKRLLYGLYSAYVEQTQGRHFVNISKSLKTIYSSVIEELDKEDDEIVNEVEIDEILLKISQNVWKKIAQNELQPLLINKFEDGGIDAVVKLLTYFKAFQDLNIEIDKNEYILLTNSQDYEADLRKLQAF